MKHALASALLLTLSLGCNRDRVETANPDTAGSATMADTSATTTGVTGGTSSTMSPADKEFVAKAAEGGLAEVMMGRTAADKAKAKAVKEFGQRMITDHSKANDELKQLAFTKGLDVPVEAGQENKEAAQHLSQLSGAAFDKAYMAHMVEDHEKDVAEFRKALQNVQDPDLKAWVEKTLPTLEEHLRLAKATRV